MPRTLFIKKPKIPAISRVIANISVSVKKNKITWGRDYIPRGMEIMQEAITSVLNYGFRDMKLHSIDADANPANLPSIKLLERNGCVREAWF